MKYVYSTLVICFWFTFSLAQQLQSPQQFLGYELGTRFTRHADVIRYFEHVAEASPLLQFEEYGKTYEHRPLTYAILTSGTNHQNLETIRKNHIGQTQRDSDTPVSDKAIVWLSYNVHGNEASSTEAAMNTVYRLLTDRTELLENLVIIMDPCLNPDGRDRYVNWYNQAKSEPYTIDQNAAEHNEPWPGGRPNHYLFDLNRDWAWATQIETQQRLKIYQQWLPQIHVDFHEQGINDPYYFAPAAAPFHEIITPWQREFQTQIGKNNAKYFDEKGWLYFTRERFDLLYPSYGDTYPTYMGAIGMTYEQAGHGRSGLGIQTDEGYVLTLKDRIEHHTVTGIATVETAAQNINALNTNFVQFFRKTPFTASYAFEGNKAHVSRLAQLMDQHGLQYNTEVVSSERSQFSISENQAHSRMVKALFEPKTKIEDSLTYDITAWSLPYAYGLEPISEKAKKSTNAEKQNPQRTTDSAPAYAIRWNSMNSARVLSSLLQKGIRVRFTDKELQTETQTFGRGTLLITRSDNPKKGDLGTVVQNIAKENSVSSFNIATGFAVKGPDLGSSHLQYIQSPKIAMLAGDITSSLNYGALWYFFEQDLKFPVARIWYTNLSPTVLANYNILILPNGRYSDFLTDEVHSELQKWIKNGGKLIVMSEAAENFSNDNAYGLAKYEDDTAVEDSLRNTFETLIPYGQTERNELSDLLTGAVYTTKVDNTHPMAFGYADTYPTLKLHTQAYKPVKDGHTIAYIPKNAKALAGFVGDNVKEKITPSLVFGEKPMGKGSIVYMIDDPLFRGFWENGKLFMANALFFTGKHESDE